MTAQRLLLDLYRRDVRAWVDGGKLELDAPPGVLKPAVLAAIRAHKPELLAILKGEQSAPTIPAGLRVAQYNPDDALRRFLAEHPKLKPTPAELEKLRTELFNELPPPVPFKSAYCDELREAAPGELQ
jgi:hypothetical protein